VDVGSSLAYARDNCECNVKGVKSEKGIWSQIGKEVRELVEKIRCYIFLLS
jgi:hypothetical protein